MTDINKINPKPIETVYEIKDEYKVPSYEEFMKDYQVDEKVNNSYADELKSYGDIGVNKSYGPGGPGGERGYGMSYSSMLSSSTSSNNDDILIIAGSQSIMNKIRRDFPNVATLLDWNRSLTLGFLDKKGALSLYRGTDAFRVPCYHYDNYSKTGSAAWQEYRRKIKEYVDNISSRGNASKYHEVLAPARELLVQYIHEQYYKVLPSWPDVGQTNARSFEANIGSSYNHGTSSQVVWNCMGWIEVTDRRPATDIFEASFSGSPEIKLLVLNLDRLKEIEDFVRVRGIESAKDHIRNRQPTYQITWEDL